VCYVSGIVILTCRFARFRDVREAIHQFEGVVAACIVIAYEELSKTMVGFEKLLERVR
jgi:hypothetical protein